ncbi:MAG: hypothetical protein PHU23_12310 [Dehalococcoidales bacterium]|nr:hypothetical protein [Dehalococcoidales bacterium]
MRVISLPQKIIISEYFSLAGSKTAFIFSKIKNLFSTFYINMSTFLKERKAFAASEQSSQSFYSKKNFKIWKSVVIIIAAILLIYGGAKIVKSLNLGNNSVAGEKIDVLPARASQDINKEFTFPLKNNDGEEVSSIRMTIDKVELRDQIIISGKPATSVKGRVFLIINLKIKNEFNQTININTRDYIRLSVNNNGEEWLAPNIHNDPVEVQAISTKPTRLGFAINESDKNLELMVGEINGDKEKISLDLR